MSDGGETGALMRTHNWAFSPLGSPGAWPQSLRTVVSLLLTSKFPMFVAWGPDLIFLYNDAYAPILGKKHPWAMARPFKEVWFEIWHDVGPLTSRALGGEASFQENMPLMMLRKGYEEETYFTFSYSPVCDETGRIAGMFCACTETTELVLAERRQKEAAAALRESEARFRHLADHAPVMVWVTDKQGYCSYLSRSWYEFTGQAEEEGLGLGWVDAVHPDDQAAARETFIKATQKRSHFQSDYRLRRSDGTYRWVIDAAAPRIDETGAFLGFVGSVLDITDRKLAEDHRELLIHELNHRVKNTLATVQSIAAQTLRNASSIEQARSAFESRLFALSQAHDVLTRESWEAASLREIVHNAIEPYRSRGEDRLHVRGADVRVRPGMALALAMALQELATNAVKYGALSNTTGEISISWEVHSSAAAPRLHLRWEEKGGPLVEPPQRRGFGTRLIERSLAQELDGNVLIDFARTGVVCTVDAPLQ
jgi:PAS domain S-box-containing protein